MIKKRTFFWGLLVLIFIFSAEIRAQEYKYEIGAVAGTSFYLGDANKTKLFQQPGAAFGIMHRYNISLNWAVKSNLIYGNVSGDTGNSGNKFPNNAQTAFARAFVDLGSQIEYNFFPYSDKFSFMNARRYTPYLFAGAGVTYATGEKVYFNVNLPIGIGFKYKVKEKLNAGLQFSVHKLFGDDFDVTDQNGAWNLDAPYGIKSSLFKNKDWYSLTMIFISWEFGLKNDPCCGP